MSETSRSSAAKRRRPGLPARESNSQVPAAGPEDGTQSRSPRQNCVRLKRNADSDLVVAAEIRRMPDVAALVEEDDLLGDVLGVVGNAFEALGKSPLRWRYRVNVFIDFTPPSLPGRLF